MREYTITMSFSVKANNSDYESISEFAEKLSENIMNSEELIYDNDIEIVEIIVDQIEDNNDYLDEEYLDEEDED